MPMSPASKDRIRRARELGFAGRVIGYAASLPDTLARRTRELGVERSIQKPENPYSLLETGGIP